MRMFICPYCGEDHSEADMKKHFLFQHEDLDNPPSNFQEYELRYGMLGLSRIVGEDDPE